MSSIYLRVQYKEEEVNQGYWEVYRRLVLPHQLLAVFCISFAIAQGYACVSAGLGDVFFAPQAVADLEEGRLIMVLLLAGVGIPFTLCGLTTAIIYSRVMKSYESRPNFHFPIVYVLGDNGLNITFASGQGTLDWDHLRACVETAHYFCLVTTPSDIFVLPKRCLSCDEDVKDLRLLIVKKVRTYLRHSGKDLPIKFEGEKIVLESTDDADQEAGVIKEPAALEESAEENIEGNESVQGSVAIPRASTAPLERGLALDVIYQAGEIQAAEKIFFFRKRLPAIALGYLTFIGLFMPSAFAISCIWGRQELFWELFANYGWLSAVMLPILAFHSMYVFLLVTGRANMSEQLKNQYTFQLTEEGCGLSSGDRYAVLAWWHFAEVWETNEAFMLLFGRQGRAMYVIPKRAFPERVGLAYVQNLLSRKVRRILNLD